MTPGRARRQRRCGPGKGVAKQELKSTCATPLPSPGTAGSIWVVASPKAAPKTRREYWYQMDNRGRYFAGWRRFLEIQSVFPISLTPLLKEEMLNPKRKPPASNFWDFFPSCSPGSFCAPFPWSSPHFSCSRAEFLPLLFGGVFPFFGICFSLLSHNLWYLRSS